MLSVIRRPTLTAVVILFAVPIGLLAQQPEAAIGVWKLNLEKSAYDPGPPPKSETRTWEDRGGGAVVFTVEGINAQGTPTFNSYTFKNDGKEYPMPASSPERKNSVSLNQIDPYTVHFTNKVNGRVNNDCTRTVSKDRKTLTLRCTGTNVQGRPFKNVGVYDRQQ
jgi:hypothetical protein